MPSKKMLNALNEQIKHELDSAYIYLAMVAYFESNNLPGMAHWMRLQGQEEMVHAMKIFDFIHDRGARVELHALGKPAAALKSPLDVFQKALKHEQKISGLIHQLYELATKEKDYPTQVMLQWFIEEQVEEEKSAEEAVEKLKLAQDNDTALLFIDQQMGQRQAEG